MLDRFDPNTIILERRFREIDGKLKELYSRIEELEKRLMSNNPIEKEQKNDEHQ